VTLTVATGTGLTVMVGVVAAGAVSLVAVIVAVPTPTAVTVVVPLVELVGLTVSAAVLLDTQLTVRPVRVLLAASFVVAVSDCVPPTTIGVVGEESVTVATGAGVTVMEELPVFPSLVAVIVTGPPAATAVTRPFPSTVATAVLFEVQLTVRPESTLFPTSFVTAASCCVSVTPNTKVADDGVTATVATGAGSTVMVGVVAGGAVSLVAVIVAVPAPTAVTVVVPFVELAGLTINTAVLLETQLTVRPVRTLFAASLVTAVSDCVPPTTIGVVGDERVTEDTGAGLTVMVGVVAPGAVSLVAVIVAVPTPTAVTVVVPFVELAGLTVSTAVLLDTQLTVRAVRIAPPASVVVAVSV
jgi:hypothetical protein